QALDRAPRHARVDRRRRGAGHGEHLRVRAEDHDARGGDRRALLPAAPRGDRVQFREHAGVIYDVRHVTVYKYEVSVASANVVLRVTPRDDDGQRRLDHRLAILPEPSLVERSRDFYGNEVAIATIETAHLELKVDASARVDVDRGAGPAPGSGPAWER